MLFIQLTSLLKCRKNTEEESKEKKNKKKGEMSNLEKCIWHYDYRIKRKLSEVSTQKNQIETIYYIWQMEL